MQTDYVQNTEYFNINLLCHVNVRSSSDTATGGKVVEVTKLDQINAALKKDRFF